MTQEQLSKLDPCYYKYDLSQPCQQEIVDARSLLGGNRFDLYAILIYIDQKVKGITDLSFARTIYKNRTLALTSDSLKEASNDSKDSFDAFINVLDALIYDFQNDRYDINRSLVPVDKNNILMDGAHRTACAAYFGKQIKILRFLNESTPHVDFNLLFNERFLPITTADYMALESCKWHDNLFMLFLWPKSYLQPQVLQESLHLIRNNTEVIYEKECKMTYTAIRNLMIQIYGHMDWVGDINNDFASTFGKADAVWDNNGKCRFMLVQAESCDYVLKLKAKVRSMFNIDLASIHSTDNLRETSLAANALFNPNSFHFISNSAPTKFKDSFRLYERFKTYIEDAGLRKDDFIVDSSMVLSMYGIREANDLDYYTLHPDLQIIPAEEHNMEEHDDTQKKYYSVPVSDLINCPENYFYFNEIKFVSLPNLLKFKTTRYSDTSDLKDKCDIQLIKNVLSGENNQLKIFVENTKIKFARFRRNFPSLYRNTRNGILMKLGIYNFLSSLRLKIKKK